MKIQDHICTTPCGYGDYRLRVLTGKIVYRLSSVRNDSKGGPHVWCRNVDLDGNLFGARELVQVRELKARTDYTEPSKAVASA